LIDSAMASLRAAHADLTDPIVTCLRHRAMLLAEQDKPAAALVDTDEAMALLQNQRIDQSGVLLNLRETRAGALAALGRLAPAIQDYEAVLAELQRRGELDSTTNSFKLNNFAVMLQRAGQSSRALQIIEQSLQAWLGPNADRKLDGAQRINYISALHSVGRIDQALPHAELGMTQALQANEPRVMSQMSLRAAEVLCETAEIARCESLIDLSAKNFATYISPTHPTLARLELLRAHVALTRQLPADAREHIARALDIMDKTGKPDGRRCLALAQLAQAHLMLGERDAALKTAQEAVAYARLHFADFPTSRWGGTAMLSLGRVQRERGDTKLAAEALQNAKTQLEASLGANSPIVLNLTREMTGLTAQK
jgi:tetratricopeptide (TPR) repeat protein